MAATAPVAQPDRRFHAFLVDRLIGWGAFALTAVAAWWWLLREDEVLLGIVVIVAVVLVVSLAFAVGLGLRGTSPGRALAGIRVVDVDTGGPIGVGRALLRSFIVGVGSLPMFGLGLAALAWTAIEDRSGQRRGWHDHVARSVVLDVRPRPAVEEADDAAPVHLVNLTAMRLAPVRAHASRSAGPPSSGA
ncbi:RDD family protein, partial [Nocardioides dubius]